MSPNTIRYRIESRILAELIRTLPDQRLGATVLDAGAGSGEMSLRLQHAGFCDALIGVEPFPENYRILQQTYGDDPSRRTHCAELGALPVDSESVDAVVSTQVFEHIEDDAGAAREVARVVRPGGLALISTPHPPEMFPGDGHVRPGYTEEQMRALFEPVGFGYLDKRYFFVRETTERVRACIRWGRLGRLLPVAWADRELGLSQEEMFARQPYGIACLFRRS